MDVDPYQPNSMSWNDWVEDFMFDDSEECYLQLALELYGQSSSSKPRRMPHRNGEEGHECLVNDYFALNSVYPTETFRQKFDMRRHVFLFIVEAFSIVDPYF